jgi:hypothetical protein
VKSQGKGLYARREPRSSQHVAPLADGDATDSDSALVDVVAAAVDGCSDFRQGDRIAAMKLELRPPLQIRMLATKTAHSDV